MIELDPHGHHRELGLDTFLASTTLEDNAALSPLGLWLICAALRAGARRATGAAWAELLGLPDAKLTGLGPELAKLAKLADVATVLGLHSGGELNSRFETCVRRELAARVIEVDFGDPVRAAATLDAWASEATSGLIDRVPVVIDARTRLLPLNALHFDARWDRPFAPATPGRFHDFDGQTTSVPTMRQTEWMRWSSTPTFEAVALRCQPSTATQPPAGIRRNTDGVIVGVGGLLEVVFLLPRAHGRDAFARARETPSTSAIEALKPTLVDLELPRFRLRTRHSTLAAAVQQRATAPLFGSRSDYTGISLEPGFAPDELVQEVFVEIDERGARAASVTGARVLAGISVKPPKPVVVRFDRPFFFFVHEPRSATLLFIGQVIDPRRGRAA